MSDRAEATERFLAMAGWGHALRVPLAGDASARTYQRLTLNGENAVLMDAPVSRGESVEKFSRMARWLRSNGFSAPEILCEDVSSGFLLVEDLGDDLFARIVGRNPDKETELYEAATGFLVALHLNPPPDFLAPLDGMALGDLIKLTLDWYLPGAGGGDTALAASIPAMIETEFARLRFADPVVSLRDFHAENLIWLPARTGVARVGLLDFQDAVVTDPAYDLVSLLQDARRDVSPLTESATIAGYCHKRALPEDLFAPVYALLGAQRALRILGVFARLALQFGRPHYLDFVPRVWAYLERNLRHPEMSSLAEAVRGGLSAPTPDRLQRIKDSCGTIPNP